jgi:hypothetical protein
MIKDASAEPVQEVVEARPASQLTTDEQRMYKEDTLS